ncbi:TIR domain-containing protein [Patescibacteria group bacterium]|nr:TIR domain-containing protein [Patescibacteria group bacterium]MCG2701824.1 TIR domain-containing protein [Candidatus Parcubacteria bacterium]MBU4265231.1 TIR domain-containing protein [Patescibacteria group bacterium]MBU4390292.1 TIR domain-containing protein [Patescibacteria group bacterium]MBU4431231.1 TIR domain-containing protein [Patescibacteria group bacterium]
MKAKDKPKFVKEARTLLGELDVEKLISDPNDLKILSKINRLIVIFTDFSSNDGQELERLLAEYQKWGRRSTRVGHIKNRVVDMLRFIDQKIGQMALYVIEDETSKLVKSAVTQDEKFDVAFSFAGEQRDYVAQVAQHVENKGNISVFYDDNYELDMWGNNMVDYFKDIFENRANYCVMFISKEYANKTWPNFERQIIQAKSLFQEGYLLPVRFDDTQIKGEVSTVKYLSIKGMKPENLGERIIKKVVGSDKYTVKKETKVVTVTSKANIATPEEIPLLYIKPNVGKQGGPKGHFLHFTVKNMSNQVLFDINWGMRGFNYEWRPKTDFFELEPEKEKELTFPLSSEAIFKEEIPELNVFAEYKDLENRHFFARRELKQEKVPSGAFFAFKAAEFHKPSLLRDDGLKLLSGPNLIGDRYEIEFEVKTSKGIEKAKIGVSKTFLSVWDMTEEDKVKQVLVELGHRQMRKMTKEGRVGDYVFVTTSYPLEYQRGFEGYKKLRDAI